MTRRPGAARHVARRLRQAISEVRSPGRARNRRDDAHLRLLLAFALRRDSSCVDVGAHRGGVLSEIVRNAPKGHHLAYEPLPVHAVELRSAFPSVDVRQAAVGAASGRSRFVHVTNAPALSGLRERTYKIPVTTEQIEVEVVRLDEDLPTGYAPSLIKIDVEGGELGVLEGALGTITEHRPIVVLEHGVGGAPHYGTTPAQVYRLLCEEAGLVVYDLDGDGPYDVDEFTDAALGRRNGRWNWVARP